MTVSPASAEESSNSSIAFPVRLQQGLLRRTDERDAYLTLIAIMARTPRGSWSGNAQFGFNEFFSELTKEGLSEDARRSITLAAVRELNAVLADLGLTRYQVESIVPDPIKREAQNSDRQRWAGHLMENRGITLTLRDSATDRTTGYVL
jgi:hypothetical protein